MGDGIDRAVVQFAGSIGSAPEARRFVSEHLAATSDAALALDVDLMVSEIVTNAIVHGRAPIELRLSVDMSGCRVEVHDHHPGLPRARHYSETSMTGRGLHIVETLADRWGAFPDGAGKVVWFEVGDPRPRLFATEILPDAGDSPATRAVITLCQCPLLLHLAWQEHTQALLRRYALTQVRSDSSALSAHAQAGAALSLLFEQLPVPPGIDIADALLGATDPQVTADEVHVELTPTAPDDFEVLLHLLRAAYEAGRESRVVGPTQPELVEFGEWVCAQVRQQRAGAPPEPWLSRTPVDAGVVDHSELSTACRERWDDATDHVIVTDEASIILRATRPVLDALGYARESDLVGRRVLMVVPRRFHQAHLAGTALHSTNGRGHLLGTSVVVPVIRADGTELLAGVRVEPTLLPGGHRVFVADVRVRDRVDPPPPGAQADPGLPVLEG